MKVLTSQNISVTVPGKTILLGEHSVVYGHGAVALALNDIQLEMTFVADSFVADWEEAFEVFLKNQYMKPSADIARMLYVSLKKALSFFQINIEDYLPTQIQIHSDIPLGGGMGGSAAISCAFVLLCARLAGCDLSRQEQIEKANEIDSLFHFGRASGLDVSAILSKSFIYFRKGHTTESINPKLHFWVVLVDSKKRSQTSEMVKLVSDQVNEKNLVTLDALEQLGVCALDAKELLLSKDYNKLCQILNKSHELLKLIGVSTPELECLREKMFQLGADASKITGAGGGGLILSIFKENPEFLVDHFCPSDIFITKV